MKSIVHLIVGVFCCVLVSQFPAVANARTQAVLYSFCADGSPPCADGSHPSGTPIDVNGMLYGVTSDGGKEDSGILFSLDRTSGAQQTLHSFGDIHGDGLVPTGSLINVKGTLYGTTSSTVFAYDLSTGVEGTVYAFCRLPNCADGNYPQGGLVKVGSLLYGVTNAGGSVTGNGTIFSFNPKTHALSVLHSFGTGVDGGYPEAGLISVNGVLYGTTSGGGALGRGTLFSFDPNTGKETVIHSFGGGADGTTPKAALLYMNGLLYGTTWDGGTDNYGSVFSIDPSTGTETVLHSFNNKDGQWPVAGLINVKGTLYGTTFYGGAYTTCGDSQGCGTVFSLNPATGKEKLLYSFGGPDGALPIGALRYENGTFYGMATYGGASGRGVVYSLTRH